MKTIINNALYADTSPTAGQGLFARKLIKKGENLFIAFARADYSADNSNNTIFELHFTQQYPNNFVNHSDQANTQNFWAGQWYIVKRATRDIQPGEEIFSNYEKGMELIRSKNYSMNNWLAFKK